MDRYQTLLRELKKLASATGISFVRLSTSFLICRLFHGASWDNFCVLEMYRYTNKERKRIYTHKRQKKISDSLNAAATEQDVRIITDKNLFNATFYKFIQRDWYDACTSDKRKLQEFLENNDTFLEKPVLSSCGRGIELFHSADVSLDEFFDRISGKKVILEGFIKQHREMAEINPSSVNTVRLVTAKCGNSVYIVGGGVFAVAERMRLWIIFIMVVAFILSMLKRELLMAEVSN